MDFALTSGPLYLTAPATAAIRYEKKRLWREIDGPNPFTGKPRPELDVAWRDIIARKYVNILP